MTHIKWLVALAVITALSITITYNVTEKYMHERTIGQLSEMSIMRNAIYVTLVKEIDAGKHTEVRAKLLKMFDMEVRDIQQAKKLMEDSYFATENKEYIDRVNHYLARPVSAPAMEK